MPRPSKKVLLCIAHKIQFFSPLENVEYFYLAYILNIHISHQQEGRLHILATTESYVLGKLQYVKACCLCSCTIFAYLQVLRLQQIHIMKKHISKS